MRFAFSRDQLLFRDSIRDVLRRECTAAVVRGSWERADAADKLWQTLAELGVVGLTIPEEYGGLGLGALDWVLLFEECGRFAAPTGMLETMAVAAPLIASEGSEAQKGRWLTAIAEGETRIAVGSLPHQRSSRRALELMARDADTAAVLLLERNGTFQAVPRAEVTLVPEPTVDRSRRMFRVTIDPNGATESLGSPAGLEAAFDRAALAASAELLGLSARMIEMTVDYAKVRKQFGAPIGSFQAVKHHLATAHMRVELARPAVYRAAYSVAQADRDASTHVSMAKACASDAASLAARVALQCHGAIGYSFEHDLHLWMKRAWALAAAWGDAGWHRARVATAVISSGDNP